MSLLDLPMKDCMECLQDLLSVNGSMYGWVYDADEKLSIADVARRAGCAYYYLSRKFKAEMGISLNDYIKRAKVERAKTLLLSTDLNVQEICERLHFGSRSFFAETFKEVTGTTPAAFRREREENPS